MPVGSLMWEWRRRGFTPAIGAMLVGLVVSIGLARGVEQAAPGPEARAAAWLAGEMTAWQKQHDCYSCHHNADAARALFKAASRGHIGADVLKATRTFLESPASWERNKGHEADEVLARLQFAGALTAAGEQDLNPSPSLAAAAKILLADQMPDGSWVPDASDGPGSPVTWGTAVATWMARSTLIASGREPDDFAVVQADRWFRAAEATTITDAAGIVLGLGITSDVMADKQRATLLNLVRYAERESGGWGPLPAAESATVFDTALVLIALQQFRTDPRLARSTFREEELANAISRGRRYLIAEQHADGSWPATMRRTGAPSEAQRISTAAWALLALVD
jgi:hypothetical protein